MPKNDTPKNDTPRNDAPGTPAPKAPAKPHARLPRGFIDRDAADLAASERMLAKIREVYERYGFEGVETPFVEFTDALGKFLPDQDRPNEGVFSFQDDDGQWLSLRYDLTAPLARYVAENYDRLPKPYRSYRAGWVFRNEKPGPGRFRQFMQFDADTVGAASVAADAEICMMAADTLEALGIARGDYVIKVNNRKILDGVMEAIGLGGEENAGRRLTVLRAIDKLDRLGVEGVRALLGPGRKDESGDFTKGAGLGERQIELLIEITGEGIRDTTIGTLVNLSRLSDDQPLIQEALNEVAEFVKLCSELGYMNSLNDPGKELDERILITPSVVRGLEYYTGLVFEAELTFEVTGEDGRPVRFGSVGGGGRYDGLVGRFRGEDVPATGFSIGVSRLMAALKAVKSPLVAGEAAAPLVVVTAMDGERMADYQGMAAALRAAGIRAEVYLGAGRFGAQMKYADRRKAAIAIIQGTDEKARGEVQIKDLVLGAELAASGKDRADYLELQARAQFAVAEADLVAEVRKVLARRG
jgi:histidyl-tRNA synthetase